MSAVAGPGPDEARGRRSPAQARGARHLLLWDGDCGVCARVVAWIGRRDTRHRFEAIPYQHAPPDRVAPELRAACAKALHVVAADGRVLKAGRASLFVLGELGWRRTARLFAWPPLVWLVELGYRIVAAHRGRISRWLPGSSDACRIEADADDRRTGTPEA